MLLYNYELLKVSVIRYMIIRKQNNKWCTTDTIRRESEWLGALYSVILNFIPWESDLNKIIL